MLLCFSLISNFSSGINTCAFSLDPCVHKKRCWVEYTSSIVHRRISSLCNLTLVMGYCARNSAFQVALEVLNAENRTYQLVSSAQNTECDWQQGQLAAEMMVTTVVPALIGAVGPACSDAAMSAARSFLDHNYTLISFAATSELLSGRGIFQNFFRTV